jgi:Putative Ig domain
MQSLSITIISPPSITTSSLPSWTAGVAYSQTLAATGGTAPYTWTTILGTLPWGLSLNSSGVISGTPATAGGPTSVTFQVTDSANKTANKSLSITINPSPSIATVSLTNGAVGVAYAQTLSVTGGTSPYTWSIASGSLPSGLSISSSGGVSGTPTSGGGPTSITFQVKDLTGATATKTMSIMITTPPSISTGSLPNGTVGTAYSQTLTATGGTTAYSWTIVTGSLPAGLFLSSSGVISGTPTAAVSSSSVTFQVTDNNNLTATKVLSITTAPASWDINMDGSINVLDMTLIGQDFGQTGTPGWIREDVNNDGVINILDLLLIGQHWTG